MGHEQLEELIESKSPVDKIGMIHENRNKKSEIRRIPCVEFSLGGDFRRVSSIGDVLLDDLCTTQNHSQQRNTGLQDSQ